MESPSSRQRASAPSSELLLVEGLSKHFPVRDAATGRKALLRAVSGVDFAVGPGETLGIVGESGSGKSTLGRMIVRLERPTAGRIVFCGNDLATLRGARLREVRTNIQIVFQDPFSSLDARMRVHDIVAEPIRAAGAMSGKAVTRRVHEILERVGLRSEHADRLPREFSGGQRQRIGIARALVLEPKLVVLDEPVSALDVSIQAQILNLLADLQRETGVSYVFISHDLSVVQHFADRVAVMYLGRFVEVGGTAEVYDEPRHPYTKALLSAVPEAMHHADSPSSRIVLRGEIPNPADPPSGCGFRTRCWLATDVCASVRPDLGSGDDIGHLTACHLVGSSEA